MPEPVSARDIAPSMTLSKATVDFSSAVMAFMRALVLVLRKFNTDNSCTFFCLLVTSVSCAAHTVRDRTFQMFVEVGLFLE